MPCMRPGGALTLEMFRDLQDDLSSLIKSYTISSPLISQRDLAATLHARTKG